MDKGNKANIESIIETDCTSFVCAACFSLLPNGEEIYQHECFDGKTIYSNEGMIYCLSDDNNEETSNENDYSMNVDDINVEQNPSTSQLKHTPLSPPKKPNKNVAMWTDSMIYCLSDDDDNEETSDKIDYNMNVDNINVGQEPYTSQLKHTPPKKPNKNVAMWTDSSTLALLTCYEAKKEDLDHPVKRGKVWVSIADELSELGYKFSGEQVRWKFNTLTRKYKDCVDNSKRTGTGAMTFKFFDHMENILGDRRTVQGQSTISSTFAKKNLKSKSTFVAQDDTSISSSPNTSSTGNTNSAKKRIYEDSSKSRGLNKNKQALGKVASSNTETTICPTSSTGNTNSAKKRIYEDPANSRGLNKNKQALEKVTSLNTETTVCPTSVSNTQKSKRPQHGSGSRTAASKMELEKQWLQHLNNVADRDKIKKEKQEAYEKRKAEEVQMKKKLIALKERQLDIKQDIAERKQEEAGEWHRDKLKIEKEKCRLLK
ncbi:uncharacterized protein [Temnothorax nylanderi]|uniref:uncharacterized protein n=1 Tax=Temnothorax nylanderi TaxID=102681 RepID=UPI003A888D52